MQVVGEKLSLHVLANYEEFLRGVNEVASIEKDLQVGVQMSSFLVHLFLNLRCITLPVLPHYIFSTYTAV